MFFLLPVVLLAFVLLCLATTGLRRPIALERAGLFLLTTSLLTALFFGAYRWLGEPLALGALAKMMGEANYAFLILFLRWLRKPMTRSDEIRGSALVVGVALLHLMLNLSLTGQTQLLVMTVQVLVLIGWLTLEAWWLWRKEPVFSRLVLMLLAGLHGCAEALGRSWLLLATDGQLDMAQPGWTDARQEWLWVTFFLGFMAQLAVAAVITQALRQEKDRLSRWVHQVEKALHEKEALLMTLLASNEAQKVQPQLASLAHELRQPLGAIQLNAEFLASGEGLSREEERRVLQDILRENHRAVSILQGLRGLFDHQPVAMERLNMSRWLTDWVDHQAPVVRRQFGVDLRLRAQPDLVVRGHSAQLEMVLHNLVNNAIEAMLCQPERAIDIELYRREHQVYLAVRDQGPGLAQELQEKVFEMSYSTKSYGMGLGLWLSRRIVHLHRGILESVPVQEGACLQLCIPLESV
ncbi:MAG: sensor histidine kinase [Limnohabitans sp.]